MPPITRFLTVCAFFCRCNSAFAFPDHEGVGVVVLSHLYHRLIQLQMREQWRAAWGHVRGHTHHALTPFAILHSEYESTHSQYFAPYQIQKPGLLEEDRPCNNTR